jgi:hypothetical protein
MERRAVLKALAAIPFLGWLVESVVPASVGYLEHTLIFRQWPDGPNMFEAGTDTSIGVVWQSFHEVWEIRDGMQVRRLSQRASRRHRIVSRDEQHSYTFSDYNNIDRFARDDPNAIYLQDVTDEPPS